MTGIHPIQGFKNMSTGKKVATVAGAALVATTVAAGIVGKGKGIPTGKHNRVLLNNILAGYGFIAGKVAFGVTNAAQGIAKFAKNTFNSIASKFHK